MLAKPPMFRKPCRKNQNSPQPEKALPPSVCARIINRLKYLGLHLLTLENLWYLGVSLLIGGIGNHAISGNAFPAITAIYLILSGIMVLVIRGVLEYVPLPSMHERTINLLFCLGLGLLFIGGALIFPISGNAFAARWVVVSGLMTLGISLVLEDVPLPSVEGRIRTINVLNCLGLTLFIEGIGIVLISGNLSSLVVKFLIL